MSQALPRQYPAWVHSWEETAAHYDVDIDAGLSEEQVQKQRAKYGYNELEKAPGKPLWKLVLEQFDDMLVKVCCRSERLAYHSPSSVPQEVGL